MAVATTDVGSFAFIFHGDSTGRRLQDGIDQLKASLRQTVDEWDPFSAEAAKQADFVQAKADRLRDLLNAAEKKEEIKILQAYRPYECKVLKVAGYPAVRVKYLNLIDV